MKPKLLFVTLFFLFHLMASASEKLKTIHVFVALCDNKTQGIVPVPKQLGNGDDPRNNLYWGALYGVKTFFKKHKNWSLLKTEKNPTSSVLQRCVFKHRTSLTFIVADAYRGSKIKKSLEDFYASAAGQSHKKLKLENKQIPIYGGADLVVYTGHNGLMDFKINKINKTRDNKPNDAIILACKSKQYFLPGLSHLGSRPVLLTTGFMAPEAYTLEAAIEGWRLDESGDRIRKRAAAAYNKYQKCGIKGATRLFYSNNK